MQLRPLEVRADLHEALRDGVRRRRTARGVLRRQPDPQKVAAWVQRHRERVGELAGGVAQRSHREREIAARVKRGRGRRPAKAERRADRVADRTLLQFFALRSQEAKRPARPVRHDAISARTVGIADLESRKRPVSAALGRKVQLEVARHLIEHDVGLEQIDPRVGLEQLIGTDRPAAGAARLARLDPDGGLYLVAGWQQATGEDSAEDPHARQGQHPPAIAARRRSEASPVERLDRLGRELAR